MATLRTFFSQSPVFYVLPLLIGTSFPQTPTMTVFPVTATHAPPPPVPPPAAPVPPPVAGRAISSERSNLLADIRKGAALKKVEVDDLSNPGSTNAPVAGKGKGGGGNLADQLRIIMAQRRVQTKAEQVEDDEDDDW